MGDVADVMKKQNIFFENMNLELAKRIMKTIKHNVGKTGWHFSSTGAHLFSIATRPDVPTTYPEIALSHCKVTRL